MALTWAAPRIARQARSPPAIPMTTRTTSNTPSTPSKARTTRWDHFTLLPSLTAPPSPRSHTDWRQRPRDSKAPQRAAAPKRRKSVPTPVPASQSHLGPSDRRFFFFLNVYLTFWEKNNGWYEWFFQKVYLNDLKKPLRQKKSFNQCEEIPPPFQIIQKLFYIVISSVGWLLIFHCLNACSTLTYQYTITHAQRRWHCRRYGGCGQDGQ